MSGWTRMAAFVVVAGALGLVGWLAADRPARGAADAEAAGSALLPVELTEVEHQTAYEVVESHAGRVMARRTSELGFERGGRLEAVLFDDGDRVEAGAELARLDTRELRARRRELVARERDIDAQLALARVTAERRQKLSDAGHLAPQQLDEALFRVQGLEAQQGAARAAIENLDVHLDLSVIRAPYAGSIARRMADEGTILSPGQPILRLLEDGALEVHIGVPPDAATDLVPGSEHAIQIEGQSLPGVLDSVLRTIDPDTRTVRAVFHLEGAFAPVRDGALARVTLRRRVPGEGYWLPITALSEGHRGLWTAYVAEPADDGTLRIARRQLELIHAEADRAYVRGTLAPGDRIVKSGVHRLVPGQAVRAAGDAP